MKNKCFVVFLGLLIFGFVFVGCDTGSNSETTPQPQPKYLKITGLPAGTKNVYVGVDEGRDENVARAIANLDGTKREFTFSLKEPGDQYWLESHPKWTGSGNFILYVNIYLVDSWEEADKTGYFYSEGQPIAADMSNGLKRFNFSDESPTKTVDLSMFAIPGMN